MIKVAILLSSLDSQAPVFVVKDLITGLKKKDNIEVELFYLDDIISVDFPGYISKISWYKISQLKSFDIVHSHGIRPDILTNILPKSTIKISTQHNIIYEQFSIIYNKKIAKFIEYIWIKSLEKKQYIVAIGDAATQYYERKLPKNTIVNIANGRNATEHKLNSSEIIFFESLKEKHKIIGACTRAVKLKGHTQIIEALPSLPDYSFVLIGDGPYLNNLKSLASQLNVSDRCFFLGYKEETYGYLKFFDIYALTSYSESISIALIEAASAQKSIVCSNIDSNKYLFSEKEVAFFELDNIDSFKRAITHAYNNKELINNVYRKYLTKYTTENMVDQYYKLYQIAIQNKG